MPRTKQCRRTRANGSTSAKVATRSCAQNRAIVVCSARSVRCRALQSRPVATKLAAAPKRRGHSTSATSSGRSGWGARTLTPHGARTHESRVFCSALAVVFVALSCTVAWCAKVGTQAWCAGFGCLQHQHGKGIARQGGVAPKSADPCPWKPPCLPRAEKTPHEENNQDGERLGRAQERCRKARRHAQQAPADTWPA